MEPNESLRAFHAQEQKAGSKASDSQTSTVERRGRLPCPTNWRRTTGDGIASNWPLDSEVTLTGQDTMNRLLLTGLAILGTAGCGHHSQNVLCEDPTVPLTHPLGAVSYAHYAVMEENGEAADFVVSSGEFEPNSTDLTAAGRDHVLEIGARMGGTPYPVLIEPGDNPELDARRRDLVVRVLSDLGNVDTETRTVISRPYSDGMPGSEAVAQ